MPTEYKHHDPDDHRYTCKNDLAIGWVFPEAQLAFGSYELTPGIHHTYVTGYYNSDSGKTYEFPCWGGTNGKGDAFGDESHSASMHQAIRVCCSKPVSKSLPTGTSFGGSSHPTDEQCGLTYGLTGVCHQMANRVMSFRSVITVSQIPDTFASYAIYGAWGSPLTYSAFSEGLFEDYLGFLGYESISKPDCVDNPTDDETMLLSIGDSDSALLIKARPGSEEEFALWAHFAIYPEGVTADQHKIARELFTTIHAGIIKDFAAASDDSTITAESICSRVESEVKAAAEQCAQQLGDQHQFWKTILDHATSGLELDALRASLEQHKAKKAK